MAKKVVPLSTFEYLKDNIASDDNYKDSKLLRRVIKTIKSQNRGILCGLGIDAYKLMSELEKKLDEKEIEKIEYYDKKALQLNYSYRVKRF